MSDKRRWEKAHPEQVKISRDKWNKNHKEQLREYAKKYWKEHKQQILTYHKKWVKNNPWYNHWHGAKKRCLPDGEYYPRVTFNLSVSDVRELWFRDRAWLLKQPSIDRINNGHYIKEGCRFIEMLDNALLGSKQYSIDCKNTKLWRERG